MSIRAFVPAQMQNDLDNNNLKFSIIVDVIRFKCSFCGWYHALFVILLSVSQRICVLTIVLSAENCARAVALVEDGRNYGYVAIVLNTSRSTIERVEWRNISQVTTRGLIDGMHIRRCSI